MNIKILEVVKALYSTNDWLTAKQLSFQTNLSVRTIKQYVEVIRNISPNSINSSHLGYLGNKEELIRLLEKNPNHIPQNSEERVRVILNRLIRNKEGYDTYDLADELCISVATLKLEIPKIKRKLAKFDLILKSKKEILFITGLEKNKRKLLSYLLYEESNDNLLTPEKIQESFKDTDIYFIHQVLIDKFEKHHYFINDFSLINLILHLAISVERIQNDYPFTQTKNYGDLDHHGEKILAQEIANELEEYFHISYSEGERYELSLLLSSRATSLDYKSIDNFELKEIIGDECFALVKALIENLNAFYYIDLTQKEFLTRFSLHIRNLLIRAKNNYYSKNPLTKSIKASCPLLFESSVYLSKIIFEKTNIVLNDDEIAYLAIHVGSAIEIQKDLQNKISCIVICPNYYNIETRLLNELNQNFSNKLFITNILTNEKKLKNDGGFDLIITTIPINIIINKPIINVSIFLTAEDNKLISAAIESITLEKERNLFEKNLKQIINSNFFRKNLNFNNKEEVLDYLIEEMNSEGYLNSDFKDEVLERERISSTAFNNIAIPHSMEMKAKKTGMFVLISDKGIMWDKDRVNLILLLSINRNDRALFNFVFEALTMTLTNKENLNSILQADTYQEFIDKILACK